MKTTRCVALCGAVSALSAVMLLMTVFPYATYALAALAGIMLIPAALECGTRYGVIAYVVTALLSLLLTPDIEAKWLFVLFFGYYPIVALRLQLWYKVVLAWVVKFAIFNAAAVAGFFLLITFMGVPKDEFTIGGMYLPGVLLLLGNAVFVVYDVALVRVTAMYRVRLHPYVVRLMK